jgi:hypothetical protein
MLVCYTVLVLPFSGREAADFMPETLISALQSASIRFQAIL